MNYSKLVYMSLLGVSLFTQVDLHATQSLQHKEEAVKYFENEINFTTNPVGVKWMLANKPEEINIIDVRRAEDFHAGHIPGAINIPFDQWDSFEGAQVEFPGLKKDRFNYVYCYELLCNLGAKAGKKFASLGYPTKEIKGGFQSWQEKGYTIEK